MKIFGLAIALAFASAAPARGADIPAAVIADLPRDTAHPASNEALLVPSAGEGMNAVFYLAAGEGPKPTLILLHGLPGNEQNLDLAQAVRRAGWNVLTLHYRGSWGSPGRFSIANAVEDAGAALALLRDPAITSKYRVDAKRIVIGGHSMGGFAAALQAAKNGDVAGLVLLDAWDAGATAREVTTTKEAAEFAASFNDLGNSLAGATGKTISDEVLAHAQDWSLGAFAPQLAKIPTLTIWAEFGNAPQMIALARAIEAEGGKRLTALGLPSDHAFADARIALSSQVVKWLAAIK